MKTHSFSSVSASLAALALVTASIAPVSAQSNQSANRANWGQATPDVLPATLQPSTAEAEARSLGRVAGRPLRGINHEDLGAIADFLIDTATGQVVYAVVPSGRGASGDTFRLLPMAAIDPTSATSDASVVRIGKNEWDQAGTITVQEFLPQMTFSPEQQRRTARQFSLRQGAPSGAANLTRAFSLRGQVVNSGNQPLGTIEDAAIDLGRASAVAILKPTRRFVRTEQKFLVPFDRLQISGLGQGQITSTLSPYDFQQAQTTLTPTGYPSGALGQPNQRPLTDSTTAVQQAVGNSGVQAISESRIVLRGTVENQQRKVDLERAAKQAAPGVRIDSEITVRGW